MNGQDVTAIFDFEAIAPDRYRAAPAGGGMARLYGGQVFSQAMAAAQATSPDARLVHSAHAYFVGPGDPHLPIDFAVSRDRDGRSFSARRVEARQQDRLILTLSASLHADEGGQSHQFAMPDVPGPETLTPQDEVIRAVGDRLSPRHHTFWLGRFAVDYRAVEPFVTFDPPHAPPVRHFWMRVRDPVGDDPAHHQRLLAYASDLYILHTGLAQMGVGWSDPELQDASLDHAIWFHDRFRADEWLLYALDSPRTAHARAIGRGLVFAQDGRLVASVVQEGLVRLPPGV